MHENAKENNQDLKTLFHSLIDITKGSPVSNAKNDFQNIKLIFETMIQQTSRNNAYKPIRTEEHKYNVIESQTLSEPVVIVILNDGRTINITRNSFLYLPPNYQIDTQEKVPSYMKSFQKLFLCWWKPEISTIEVYPEKLMINRHEDQLGFIWFAVHADFDSEAYNTLLVHYENLCGKTLKTLDHNIPTSLLNLFYLFSSSAHYTKENYMRMQNGELFTDSSFTENGNGIYIEVNEG